MLFAFVILLMGEHGSTVGNIAASQLRGPRVNPELGLHSFLNLNMNLKMSISSKFSGFLKTDGLVTINFKGLAFDLG